MKRMLLMGVILALALAPVAWAGMDKTGVPKVLYENFKACKPVPLPSQHIQGLTVAGAYEIQGLLIAQHLKAGETVAGFKAGLTSKPAQRKFKASGPVSGVLLKSMQITGGVVDSKPYHKMMLEVEIGYILGRDLNQPVTPEQARAAVANICPAVEVPDLNFATFKGLTVADIVADNVGARGFILGKPVSPRGIDVNTVTGRLFRDGKPLGPPVPGKAALGDQWKALAWTLNNVLKTGGEVKKGMVVITGCLGRMNPGRPGSYRALYSGGLGELSFKVK